METLVETVGCMVIFTKENCIFEETLSFKGFSLDLLCSNVISIIGGNFVLQHGFAVIKCFKTFS